MTVPGNVRAVLVGVETYDFGPTGDLDGPAADAGRMADFLVARGLPADRIDLLVATPKPPSAQVPAREVTADDLYRYFNEELAVHRSGALIVYWAGHGFEYDRQQWLCLPGASMKNLQALNLTGELLPVLAGYPFPEQYVFVDACRTRYHRAQLPAGPIGRRFAAKGSGAADQYALLAAPSGAATPNRPDRRAGAFSEALLAALTAQSAWPWLMDEVVTAIARTTALPPIRVTSSRPSGESVSVALGREVSPTEIGQLLAQVPRMTNVDRLHRVADELQITHGLRLGDVESPEELVWTLHRSSLGLNPLLELALARPDYFRDVPATRQLILALEANRAR
uniref:caspase family protein n=1 Tax=Paractinoplanes polyasparticus TaxID=2856853 RepID=UPI001C850094|nr:caspase family protein [Actinoplanes polyasparticus]